MSKLGTNVYKSLVMLVSLTQTKCFLLFFLMSRSHCRFHAGRLIRLKYSIISWPRFSPVLARARTSMKPFYSKKKKFSFV